MKHCFILLLILSVSCKKDKPQSNPITNPVTNPVINPVTNPPSYHEGNYPIIYPCPYYPAYPGSSWTYVNYYNDTSTSTVSPKYKPHCYKSRALNGNYTDTVYVPFMDDSPIYGCSTPYNILHGSSEDDQGIDLIPIVSNVLGDKWDTYFNGLRATSYSIVTNIDTSITVFSVTYNHVIQVKAYTYINNFGTRLDGVRYYAKNIGFIRGDENSATNPIDSVNLRQLTGIISYDIKNPFPQINSKKNNTKKMKQPQ